MADTEDATRDDLVDREMIGALRAALGDRVSALIEKAVEVVEDRMRQIEAAEPVAGDAAARLAHEIGGVSGQIGLKKLSGEALALERLCRDGEEDEARAAAAALAQTARASLAAARTM